MGEVILSRASAADILQGKKKPNVRNSMFQEKMQHCSGRMKDVQFHFWKVCLQMLFNWLSHYHHLDRGHALTLELQLNALKTLTKSLWNEVMQFPRWRRSKAATPVSESITLQRSMISCLIACVSLVKCFFSLFCELKERRAELHKDFSYLSKRTELHDYPDGVFCDYPNELHNVRVIKLTHCY